MKNNSLKLSSIFAVGALVMNTSCGKLKLSDVVADPIPTNEISMNLRDFKNLSSNDQKYYLGQMIKVCRISPPSPLPPVSSTASVSEGGLPAKEPLPPVQDPIDCVPICIIQGGAGHAEPGQVGGGTSTEPVAAVNCVMPDFPVEGSTGWVASSDINDIMNSLPDDTKEYYIGHCPHPIPNPLPLPYPQPLPPVSTQPAPAPQTNVY